MKMISRFPKSFSRILSSVVNRQHSNSALQLISSRPGVSTIVAVSAVGCGVAAYSVLGKQQVPAIKRKPVWTTSGINSSENVLDVIGGSNVKILSSMQPRVVDNVTQDAARKIRKRAIFQEKEHIMLPINGDDGEFGEEFNHNVQYGINSVDMTIRSCINGFEAFNEESYLVRGICAEMYKAVREKELAKDVTDTASRKGQWLCVRILDQDIECEYDKNGNKENQIINGFEIGYYPSLDSVLEDGVTTVDDMHYYFNCLGFEKNDAPAQNSLKESETQGSLFHRIIGSYISDYRKPPYYKNQQIIDTMQVSIGDKQFDPIESLVDTGASPSKGPGDWFHQLSDENRQRCKAGEVTVGGKTIPAMKCRCCINFHERDIKAQIYLYGGSDRLIGMNVLKNFEFTVNVLKRPCITYKSHK